MNKPTPKEKKLPIIDRWDSFKAERKGYNKEAIQKLKIAILQQEYGIRIRESIVNEQRRQIEKYKDLKKTFEGWLKDRKEYEKSKK